MDPVLPVVLAMTTVFGGVGVLFFLIFRRVRPSGRHALTAAHFAMGNAVRTWQEAELMAMAHMRQVGFADATMTRAGADGGIDVASTYGAAQVKYLTSPVGRPEVQALRGAAHGHEHALFYSMAGFTPGAVQFADQARVALFGFDQFGSVWPLNGWANGIVATEEATA